MLRTRARGSWYRPALSGPSVLPSHQLPSRKRFASCLGSRGLPCRARRAALDSPLLSRVRSPNLLLDDPVLAGARCVGSVLHGVGHVRTNRRLDVWLTAAVAEFPATAFMRQRRAIVPAGLRCMLAPFFLPFTACPHCPGWLNAEPMLLVTARSRISLR